MICSGRLVPKSRFHCFIKIQLTLQGLFVQRRRVEGGQDGVDQTAHGQEEAVRTSCSLAQGPDCYVVTFESVTSL